MVKAITAWVISTVTGFRAAILKDAKMEKDDVPDMEQIARRFKKSKVTWVKLSDIKYIDRFDFTFGKNIIGDFLIRFFRKAQPKLNKAHPVYSPIDFDRVRRITAKILNEGMYSLPVVTKLPGEDSYSCLGGRHRLPGFSIVFGIDTEIPVLVMVCDNEMDAHKCSITLNGTRGIHPAERSADHCLYSGKTNDEVRASKSAYFTMRACEPEALGFPRLDFGFNPRVAHKIDGPEPTMDAIKDFFMGLIDMRGTKGVLIAQQAENEQFQAGTDFLRLLMTACEQVEEETTVWAGKRTDRQESEARIRSLLKEAVFSNGHMRAIGGTLKQRIYRGIPPENRGVVSIAVLQEEALRYAVACADILLATAATKRFDKKLLTPLYIRRVFSDRLDVRGSLLGNAMMKNDHSVTATIMDDAQRAQKVKWVKGGPRWLTKSVEDKRTENGSGTTGLKGFRSQVQDALEELKVATIDDIAEKMAENGVTTKNSRGMRHAVSSAVSFLYKNGYVSKEENGIVSLYSPKS